jgi:hypothetical protein
LEGVEGLLGGFYYELSPLGFFCEMGEGGVLEEVGYDFFCGELGTFV